MFRVIKSSTSTTNNVLGTKILAATRDEDTAEGIKDIIKGIRHDLQIFYSLNSIEDADAKKSELQMFSPTYFMKRFELYPEFDKSVDDLIESAEEMLRHYKEKFKEVQDLEPQMDATSKLLRNTLADLYDLHVVNDKQMYVLPEDNTRESLINFVDTVVDTIDGQYYGTGRGGSWTRWNLRSKDGVPVNVGIASSTNKWAPEDAWYVEIVYHN